MQKQAKTFIPNKTETKLNWFILDAAGKTLGRLTCEISKILRGKHKPTYTTYLDCGDGVIVINAEKVKVTGSKEAQKIYRYYTGSMSGLREIPYRTMKARKPQYIIEHAVKGMMPKITFSKTAIEKIARFCRREHDLAAQQPIQVNI